MRFKNSKDIEAPKQTAKKKTVTKTKSAVGNWGKVQKINKSGDRSSDTVALPTLSRDTLTEWFIHSASDESNHISMTFENAIPLGYDGNSKGNSVYFNLYPNQKFGFSQGDLFTPVRSGIAIHKDIYPDIQVGKTFFLCIVEAQENIFDVEE